MSSEAKAVPPAKRPAIKTVGLISKRTRRGVRHFVSQVDATLRSHDLDVVRGRRKRQLAGEIADVPEAVVVNVGLVEIGIVRAIVRSVVDTI